LTSDVKTAYPGPWLPAGERVTTLRDRIRRRGHRMGSVSYQSFQRVKVVAGWVIRRWQPGQSDDGGLLAGGQYTNLSVRQ